MFSFLKWWNIIFVPHAKRMIILTAYLFVGSLMVETEICYDNLGMYTFII